MMPIAAAPSDSNPRGGTLWARIPEPLSDKERRVKYDQPLSRVLTVEGIQNSISGYCLPPDADLETASIGIEVHVPVAEAIELVAQAIADLGAPPATVLEIETNKASVQFTLAEVEGR
jgi:hypothetical protein